VVKKPRLALDLTITSANVGDHFNLASGKTKLKPRHHFPFHNKIYILQNFVTFNNKFVKLNVAILSRRQEDYTYAPI
jgi:hypothetical protein